MNRARRTGTVRKHARARGIWYCGGEQARGLRESRAEGCGVLLEWLCVVVGGYPGPRRIWCLILKNKKPIKSVRLPRGVTVVATHGDETESGGTCEALGHAP